MIGLDTNILIRYLTQDDPKQSPIATAIVEEQLTQASPGFVSVVAIVETVWVLESHYGVSARKAVDAVEGLLSQDSIIVENEDDVVEAIEACRDGAVEFSDALILASNRSAGCASTLTFDRRASKLPGFELAT